MCKQAIISLIEESLKAKEWGDVRSLLDEHFQGKDAELQKRFEPYALQVLFYWNADTGWTYDEFYGESVKVRIDFLCLQVASEAFGERIPDDWLNMSDSEQQTWLGTHYSEDCKHDTIESYLCKIECHSATIKHMLKDVLGLLHTRLVEAAIDCSLPSDMNELDLVSIIGNF